MITILTHCRETKVRCSSSLYIRNTKYDIVRQAIYRPTNETGERPHETALTYTNGLQCRKVFIIYMNSIQHHQEPAVNCIVIKARISGRANAGAEVRFSASTKNDCHLHTVQTDTGTHPASYPVRIYGFFTEE